jgi:integrase
VISGTFEHAIEELVKDNPLKGILGKLGLDEKKDREPVHPVTAQEVSLFLATCKKHRKEEGLKAGKGAPQKIVFQTNDNYRSQNTIRNIWKRTLGKAKLRDVRFQDIRHSFASRLLSNGESPVYVNGQLGHSSIQMTVDIYGHLIPSSSRKAINALYETVLKCTPSAPCQNKKAATS